MKATTELREQILSALDPLFGSDGFTRKNGHFAFRRAVAASVTQSVHLNFGASESTGTVVVRPSVGARHNDIERGLVVAGVIVKASTDRVTIARSLAPEPYETTIAKGAGPVAHAIWADWQSVGRQFAHELSASEHVIASLSSDDSKDWGLLIPGMRRRLLILFLDAMDRRTEALGLLDKWESQPAGRDQIIPTLAAFASWFRDREL
jgi:hypothetical protein